MCIDPRTVTTGRSAVIALLLALAACADEGDQHERAMGGGALDVVRAPVTQSVCANGTTVLGIDVSKWQGTIDWAKVKAAGVKFAFIRVSDGLDYPDERFNANWAGAKANGILRGAYQFFRPNQDAVAQANMVIAKLASQGAGELAPVIDVEATGGQSAATIAARVGQWLNRVESQTGHKGIIYVSPYWWEDNVNSAAYASYPLWVAHWGTSCPSIPHFWSDWTFHQNSATGSINGIAGDVDLNRFNGTLAQLQALGGGDPAERVSIEVRTSPPSGQQRNLREEGSSVGKMDLYEGQTFTADVLVKNDASAPVATRVKVGVWFESPWVVPVSYTIYSDYPKKDGATWVVNDANNEPANPSHATPPASAQYDLYAMSPGETKKITFTVRAAKYSIGQVDHPDVRAWVWHVAGWYGEQTGWNDPVETNGAGGFLRSYVEHDVFARDRWTFEAPSAPETEGWSVGNAVSALAVDTADHALQITMAGDDPSVQSGPALIDADANKGLTLRARTSGGPMASRLYFVTTADGAWDEAKAITFVSPGDDQYHDLTIDLSGLAAWSGTVTRLRLDPSPTSTARYDLAELVSVASVGGTSGDSDQDGVLGAPGPDCDDGDPAVGPAAAERCNGKDDDCDGDTDETFDVGAACAAGIGACMRDGAIRCASDALAACDAVAGEPEGEACNGKDDDCDGETDEGACVASCQSGATQDCVLIDAPAGCELGRSTCAAGHWSECEQVPGCGSGDDDGSVVEGDGADANAEVGAEASESTSAARDDGCAAGGSSSVMMLAALAWLARRQRRST